MLSSTARQRSSGADLPRPVSFLLALRLAHMGATLAID